jgi:hypothetical protein
LQSFIPNQRKKIYIRLTLLRPLNHQQKNQTATNNKAVSFSPKFLKKSVPNCPLNHPNFSALTPSRRSPFSLFNLSQPISPILPVRRNAIRSQMSVVLITFFRKGGGWKISASASSWKTFPFLFYPSDMRPLPCTFLQQLISGDRSAAFTSSLFRLAVFDCQNTAKILPNTAKINASFA